MGLGKDDGGIRCAPSLGENGGEVAQGHGQCLRIRDGKSSGASQGELSGLGESRGKGTQDDDPCLCIVDGKSSGAGQGELSCLGESGGEGAQDGSLHICIWDGFRSGASLSEGSVCIRRAPDLSESNGKVDQSDGTCACIRHGVSGGAGLLKYPNSFVSSSLQQRCTDDS